MRFVAFALALVVLVAIEVVVHAAARFGAARAFGVGGIRFFSPRIETRGDSGASLGKRVLVAAAGFVANYALAVFMISIALHGEGEARSDEASMRIDVASGGPAERAGLARGDRVIAVDGAVVHDWASLRESVAAHPGTPVDVAYDRAGALAHVAITPDASGKIRITPYAEKTPISLGAAIVRSAPTPLAYLYYGVRQRFDVRDRTITPAGPIALARAVEQSFTLFSFLGLAAAYLLPLNALVAILAFSRRPRKAVGGAVAVDRTR